MEVLKPVETVVHMLAVELKVPEARVRTARSLRAELKMDSIAAVNVSFALEDHYGIEIELMDGDSFDTVDSIVAILERELSRQREFD